MLDVVKFKKVHNSYMYAITIAGACGGFLTGVFLQAYKVKDLSIGSILEVVSSGLIMMIFGAPWLLIPLMLALYPLALVLYYLLPRVLYANQTNFILTSVIIYFCLVFVANSLGWYEVGCSLRSVLSLVPTFIATIVFGYFFHRFSQNPS